MFQCCFPLCEYHSIKAKIDFHHLTPLEVDPDSKATIPLCKNHHNLIFHPESKHGQHSINTEQSIHILDVLGSTAGKTLHYQDYHGKKFFYFMESRVIAED